MLPGTKSPYYIDVKSAVTNPDLLSAIASEIAQTHKFDVVAGVAVGGVPLAVATALVTKKPYAIIRASEKGHGKKDLIIGNVREKDVLLVEDVTTSGGSALYGIDALRAAVHGPIVLSLLLTGNRVQKRCSGTREYDSSLW